MASSMNKRLAYIDIAKGIVILLMIYGHWDKTYTAIGIKEIFSFHMPFSS